MAPLSGQKQHLKPLPPDTRRLKPLVLTNGVGDDTGYKTFHTQYTLHCITSDPELDLSPLCCSRAPSFGTSLEPPAIVNNEKSEESSEPELESSVELVKEGNVVPVTPNEKSEQSSEPETFF